MPARLPSEIAITRPFYPRSSSKGVTRAELVAGLGVSSFDDLLRICERRTEHRQAACSLFWTLGGNQVGKGALTGWQEIIRPALLRGAKPWPFDAFLGLLKMIEVATGRRKERTEFHDATPHWEGWILGR